MQPLQIEHITFRYGIGIYNIFENDPKAHNIAACNALLLVMSDMYSQIKLIYTAAFQRKVPFRLKLL